MNWGDLAARAYIYGFPLVFDLENVQRIVDHGLGALPPTPFNRVNHGRALAGAGDTFVSINNDTVYSMAQLDLGVGPLLLHVPDAGGRYYVLQFVDAWTNNFAYIGKRGTGTAAGDFLLAPPGWSAEVSPGMTVIHVPTRIASIVGRWAVNGDGDLPAVHVLQDAMTLRPLDDPTPDPAGIPQVAGDVRTALGFFERYRVWSQEFPPADRDHEVQQSFAALGLTGATPVSDLDSAVRAALTEGFQRGQRDVEASLTKGKTVNGWNMTMHMFDYNLDFFEVGTVDSDRWKLADPSARLLSRAGAAKAGLWGNHGYEAAYLMTYVDDRGDLLTGEHTYALRLSPPPPVDAFWSLTMYDLPEFYLVTNPLNRYSLGDRTPGIVPDDDGGVTITMSNAEPGDAKARANWLPAPVGRFRPILRMYMPAKAVLDGSWVPPAIRRLDS